MLRSCLLMLAVYAALFAAYFYWLGPQFDPPWVYVGVGVVALVVAGCLGALVNARMHYREWSVLAAARHHLPWMDGRWAAAVGEVHPVHEPLTAPFSGEECVMCEYDVARRSRPTGSNQEGNAGSDFAGFLMNPAVVRTQTGDVKLLGFPNLADFAERTCPGAAAAANARQYLSICKFEDYSGLKLVSIVGAITDAWQDDDGLVRKNLRLGKAQAADLYPTELPSAPPATQTIPEEDEELDDQDDSDDEDLDDIDEDDFDDDELADSELEDDEVDGDDMGSLSPLPVLKEKRVKVGEKVCAIGIYSVARGGLTPGGLGADKSIKLIRGNLETAVGKARSSVFGHLFGGLAVLVLVNAAAFGVLLANRHHPAAVSKRTSEAFAAVQKGEAARLDKLLSRGLNADVLQSGRSLLHTAEDPACARVLIARGTNVDLLNDEGRTPLMEAARRNRAEIAQLLLDAKADVNLLSTGERRTALDYAIRAGNAGIEQLLRRAGGREAPAAEQPAP